MKEDTALELLEAADWKRIIRELTLYAIWQARRYGCSGTHNLLPGGKTPEDIAVEAIEKVWQGKRSWVPYKYPDLLIHLKWIVKSDMGHLFESIQHQNMKRISETSGPEEPGSLRELSDVQMRDNHAARNLDPENELILREQQATQERIKSELYALVEGDEDLELLLLCFEEGLDRPEAIAIQMGWEVSRVYNLKKRLFRRAATIKERLEKDHREAYDRKPYEHENR